MQQRTLLVAVHLVNPCYMQQSFANDFEMHTYHRGFHTPVVWAFQRTWFGGTFNSLHEMKHWATCTIVWTRSLLQGTWHSKWDSSATPRYSSPRLS
jgi:hypothetical protein